MSRDHAPRGDNTCEQPRCRAMSATRPRRAPDMSRNTPCRAIAMSRDTLLPCPRHEPRHAPRRDLAMSCDSTARLAMSRDPTPRRAASL